MTCFITSSMKTLQWRRRRRGNDIIKLVPRTSVQCPRGVSRHYARMPLIICSIHNRQKQRRLESKSYSLCHKDDKCLILETEEMDNGGESPGDLLHLKRIAVWNLDSLYRCTNGEIPLVGVHCALSPPGVRNMRRAWIRRVLLN